MVFLVLEHTQQGWDQPLILKVLSVHDRDAGDDDMSFTL